MQNQPTLESHYAPFGRWKALNLRSVRGKCKAQPSIVRASASETSLASSRPCPNQAFIQMILLDDMADGMTCEDLKVSTKDRKIHCTVHQRLIGLDLYFTSDLHAIFICDPAFDAIPIFRSPDRKSHRQTRNARHKTHKTSCAPHQADLQAQAASISFLI